MHIMIQRTKREHGRLSTNPIIHANLFVDGCTAGRLQLYDWEFDPFVEVLRRGCAFDGQALTNPHTLTVADAPEYPGEG